MPTTLNLMPCQMKSFTNYAWSWPTCQGDLTYLFYDSNTDLLTRHHWPNSIRQPALSIIRKILHRPKSHFTTSQTFDIFIHYGLYNEPLPHVIPVAEAIGIAESALPVLKIIQSVDLVSIPSAQHRNLISFVWRQLEQFPSHHEIQQHGPLAFQKLA